MSNNGCNVPNRTIFLHDNLEVLQGLNSGCIDLIYLDPPFNKNKVFSAPIGSSAQGAEFSDIFREEDVKAEWLQTIKEDQLELYQYLNGIKGVGKSYNFAYLAYMAIRLIECRRVLKQTGSLYLHCDPTMSHYLKTTLDCIFGEKNFRNEIIWMRTSRKFKGSQYEPRSFNTNTDVILFYACSSRSRLYMNRVLEPYSDAYLNRTFKFSDTHGRYYLDTAHNRPSASSRPNLCYEYRGYFPPYESGWKVGRKRMEELDQAGDLVEKNNLCIEKFDQKMELPEPIFGVTLSSLKEKNELGIPHKNLVHCLNEL